MPSISLEHYIALVEATLNGPEHVTYSPNNAQSALNAYSLPLPQWLQAVRDFDRLFRRLTGATPAVDSFIKLIGRQRRVDVLGARLLSPINNTS